MVPRPEDDIRVPPALAHLRRFPLDGALLLFDRRTGLTAICDGPETAHLRMRAPRVVQFAITNACNLACTFCSRDTGAESAWTTEDAFTMLRDLSLRGALEVAFGGGEPLVFKGFPDLVRRLDEETELAVSLTTNGTRLTDPLLAALVPHVGLDRIAAMKAVRDALGCGLGDAKAALEDLPREVLVDVSEEHARQAADALTRAGCDVEVVLPAQR